MDDARRMWWWSRLIIITLLLLAPSLNNGLSGDNNEPSLDNGERGGDNNDGDNNGGDADDDVMLLLPPVSRLVLPAVARKLGIENFVRLWEEAEGRRGRGGEEEDVVRKPTVVDERQAFTIFAPSDGWLPNSADSWKNESDAFLKRFLRHHVIPGKVPHPGSDVRGIRVRRSADNGGTRPFPASADPRQLQQQLLMPSSTVIHVIEGILCCNESEALSLARSQTLAELLPVVHATTFRSLMQVSDCDSSLDPPGVYTVLVPTDDAFARLDPSVFNALKADLPQLKNVWLYHVIPGRVPLADIEHGHPLTTKLGNVILPNVEELTDVSGRINQSSSSSSGGVVLSGARVLRPNIVARNGIIHVIDRVLVQPPVADLLTTLGANHTRFDLFLEQLRRTNVSNLLVGKKLLTVFAPTNDAMKNINGEKLSARDMLNYLVLGPYFSVNLRPGSVLFGLAGSRLDCTADAGGELLVSGAPFAGRQILATNGVIHPIGELLQQTNLTSMSTATAEGGETETPGGIHGLPPFGRPTPRPSGGRLLPLDKPGLASILDVIQIVLSRVIPLRTMVTSLLVTRIGHDLKTRGPFTVFVPTDAAFKQHKPPLFVMLIKNHTYVRGNMSR